MKWFNERGRETDRRIQAAYRAYFTNTEKEEGRDTTKMRIASDGW